MTHPIGSGVITLGLVSIPVKLYPVISEKNESFQYLNKICDWRIKTQRFCPTCNQVVEREDLVRGFEFSKGQYVQFTDAELEAFALEQYQSIELEAFLPLKAVDPVYFESTYFLGPDQGGEKAYRLLTERTADPQDDL